MSNIYSEILLCPSCRSTSSSTTTPNYLADSLVAVLYFHLQENSNWVNVDRYDTVLQRSDSFIIPIQCLTYDREPNFNKS